nr:MAG TPA: hypothetical protein [Caudoviricetes sp.]
MLNVENANGNGILRSFGYQTVSRAVTETDVGNGRQ